MTPPFSEIFSSTLQRHLDTARADGQTIVFVNGCFDLFHIGHVALLESAATIAEDTFVVVAIDTDERVRALKGEGRPIHTEADRRSVLRACVYVDIVMAFASDEELDDLVRVVRPDVMVKGSDYRGGEIIGSEHAGRIEYVEHTGESTTRIIERMRPE